MHLYVNVVQSDHIRITKRISFWDLLTATASSIVIKTYFYLQLVNTRVSTFYRNSRRQICAIKMFYTISKFLNTKNSKLILIVEVEHSTAVVNSFYQTRGINKRAKKRVAGRYSVFSFFFLIWSNFLGCLFLIWKHSFAWTTYVFQMLFSLLTLI